MRVTVEGDRHSVTYHCIGCTERLTLDAASAARAGALFVAAHRGCDLPGAQTVTARTSAGPTESLLGDLPLV